MNLSDNDVKAIGSSRWLKTHLTWSWRRWLVFLIWGITAVGLAYSPGPHWLHPIGALLGISGVVYLYGWLFRGQRRAEREMLDYWHKNGDVP